MDGSVGGGFQLLTVDSQLIDWTSAGRMGDRRVQNEWLDYSEDGKVREAKAGVY